MFNNYKDLVQYISKNGVKDKMGFIKNTPVDKYVRYIGGKEVQIQSNNGIGTEHRLLYQCPFKVEDGDKFIIDTKEMLVKQSIKVTDVFGNIVYWEVELL